MMSHLGLWAFEMIFLFLEGETLGPAHVDPFLRSITVQMLPTKYQYLSDVSSRCVYIIRLGLTVDGKRSYGRKCVLGFGR